MLLRRGIHNFRKLAQLEIPKKRGELNPETIKASTIQEIFEIRKTENLGSGNWV